VLSRWINSRDLGIIAKWVPEGFSGICAEFHVWDSNCETVGVLSTYKFEKPLGLQHSRDSGIVAKWVSEDFSGVFVKFQVRDSSCDILSIFSMCKFERLWDY